MLTRRVLLRSGGLALVSLGAGPRFLERLAHAAPAAGGAPPILVTIFLRGAMDGLMAVPPVAEEARLARLRPRLAMSATRSDGGVLDLDGRFGLHRAFRPLLPLWRDGRLAVVHAVGSPNPTRSHFDAQDYMETATPWRKGTASGWLNRVAGQIEPSGSPLGAVSLTPTLPRALTGRQPALAIADLKDLELHAPREPAAGAAVRNQLELLYDAGSAGLLHRRSRDVWRALELVSPDAVAAYLRARGSRYPKSPLGRGLLQIAFLIKAGVGLRVACAESAGWDTHVAQGTRQGSFARRADDLARSLAAFWEDVGPHQHRVVVLTMTEFGRTVRENGSGGTDHGHGSCLFVLGDRVDGGKVYGRLPSLEPANLFEGRDLPVTTDFRSVFAGVAGGHLGFSDDDAVFPGWGGTRLPVLS